MSVIAMKLELSMMKITDILTDMSDKLMLKLQSKMKPKDRLQPMIIKTDDVTPLFSTTKFAVTP
jgi:hypothetical protein